jgi:hypothetical protein
MASHASDYRIELEQLRASEIEVVFVRLIDGSRE